MRFYDVSSGEITVDDLPVEKITRKSLRKAYTMVLQDTWLFNGTIKDNIRYSKQDASDSEVIEAAKAAHVHHFIKTLPNAYNMEINEEFALYLMAVGNEMYPWLFTDIYYATGHYNQALDGKALLFEMGSHLIEKELEIESMKELADVVTTALYKTTVNKDTGDLTVNGTETKTDVIVKDVINDKQIEKKDNNNGILVASIIFVVFASMCATLFVIIYKSYKKENK